MYDIIQICSIFIKTNANYDYLCNETLDYYCNMKQLFTIFIATLTSLSVMADIREITSINLNAENGLPDSNIRCIYQDSIGYMYFFGRYNTYRYDGYQYKTLTSDEVKSIPIPKVTRGDVAGSKFQDNFGNDITLLEDGRLRYTDKITGEIFQFNVVPKRLFKLTKRLQCTVVTDKSGLIWVATNGNGITVYDRKNNSVKHISRNDSHPLIHTDFIVYMMEDHDGNIWVSGEHYGITCLKVFNSKYSVIDMGNKDEEKSHSVRMLCRLSNNKIIFADLNGQVSISDDELKTFRNIASKGNNYVAAAIDSLDRLWLGSRTDGIMVENKHYGNGRIDCILKDNKGRMWTCGLKNPLRLVDVSYKGDYSERTFFEDVADLDPRVLCQDRQQQLWMGTKQGLYVFSPDSLIANPQFFRKVLPHRIMCIYEASDGVLWVGTSGNGVFYLNNNTWKGLTVKNGLPNDNIQAITEDGDGNIVIGTEYGCSFLDSESGRIQNQVFINSRLRNIVSERCAVRLSSGHIALGTLDDIVIVQKPEYIVPVKRNLTITSIAVNGENIADRSILADGIENGVINIGFSTLNFDNQHNISYEYKLEGFDKQWTDIGNNNNITFKKLPSGKYTLFLRGRNTDGSQQQEATLAWLILPPWWQTWWAYLIYFVVVAVIITITVRQLRRMDKLRREVAVEKELTAYKLKFFTNISHEFRTPLTLIKGSMDRLHQIPQMPAASRAPISNMQRNVDRMMRLINQLLEFRRMQNNKLSLSLEETDVVAFVYNITQTFHDMAENKHITLNFTPAIKSYTTLIDRGFIDKAVYNLLSNAFKYTPKDGSITVRVAVEKELTIQVIDTGIGVPEEQREKIFERFQRGQTGRDSLGIGLDLTAELIRTHHGSICCNANNGGGSIFTISLPTDNSVYNVEDMRNGEIDYKATDVTNQKEGFAEAVMEPMPQPMNNYRVIVVEDDTDLAEYLKRQLSIYFNVRIANNGKEAIEAIEQDMPQLVITDWKMPEMNGYELITRLRKNKTTRHLPVIMLTGQTSDEEQLKGLNAGADAYITKPFNMQMLILQCRNMLTKSVAEVDKEMRSSLNDQRLARSGQEMIITSERDHKLLQQLKAYVEKHLADPALSVDKFAEEMGYGRTTFYNKLKSITGKTPNEYIKECRLLKAAELLEDERVTVAEVAYKVGMATAQYLSTTFKKRFGVTPTQYQKGMRHNH